jgi:mono/diheme cytochrome c family protein
MKKIFNFKSILLFGAISLSSLAMATEEVTETVTDAVVTSTPIYETLGVSSTALFGIMMAFTVVLLFALYSVSKTASNVLKAVQDKFKKASLLVVISLISSASFAADGGTESADMVFSNMSFWTIFSIDICIIAMIVYFAMFTKNVIKNSSTDTPPTSIFSSFTNAVDIDKEDSILLDHEYDGIRELDNDLPPWWKYGFYITIIWAVGYFFYYQVMEIGNLQTAEFEQEMADGEKEIATYKAANPNMVNAETVTLLTDVDAIATGQEIYNTNCVACHAGNGGGGIGPNLTDNNWIYNGDIKGVFNTISEGAENGMIAWKDILNPEKIQFVASYVLSMEDAVGGKEPQGDNIVE